MAELYGLYGIDGYYPEVSLTDTEASYKSKWFSRNPTASGDLWTKGPQSFFYTEHSRLEQEALRQKEISMKDQTPTLQKKTGIDIKKIAIAAAAFLVLRG